MKVENLFETRNFFIKKILLHFFNILGYLAAGTCCRKNMAILFFKKLKMKSSELGPIFSQK
jgi:hypothetical protein